MARRRGGQPTRADTPARPAAVAVPERAPPSVYDGELHGSERGTSTLSLSRLDAGWLLAIGLLVGQRIVLELVGAISVLTATELVPRGSWPELVIQGGEPWSALLSAWQRWDALWYQHIVEAGFAASDGSTAFYPLYPLLSRLVAFVVGGHVVWAELIVASAAFVVGMALLYRLVAFEYQSVGAPAPSARGRRRVEAGAVDATRRVPTLTVLLLALFPTGFYLLAPYTESLFLALTIATFWFARRGQWWLAGLAGFLAATTRAQGVFLLLPIAFEYLRQPGGSAALRLAVRFLKGERGGSMPGPGLLASLLPAMGILAVGAYHRLVTGEQRSVFDILGLWGYDVVAPWGSAFASLGQILTGNVRPGSAVPVEALNLASLLGFIALAVLATRRLPLAYALYVWPSLLLLLTRQMYFSPLMSVSRYTLVLFPCFMVLAMVLAPRRAVAIACLVVSGALQAVLMAYYAGWGFVG